MHVDGARFDSWIASINREAGSRRRLVHLLVLGATGLPSFLLSDSLVDAKKKRKKKKDRCKKSFASCSGANKCCSKRCCNSYATSGKFCGPKGSTCCPDGAACPAATPICCDPDIVFACTEPERPVCCPVTTGYPYGYSCLASEECCSEVEGYCCPINGATAASGSGAEPVSLAPPLGG